MTRSVFKKTRKKKPQKARRVKDEDKDSDESSSESSGDDSGEVKRVISRKINPAEFVAHVRRSRQGRPTVKRSRYQVPVLIKERGGDDVR